MLVSEVKSIIASGLFDYGSSISVNDFANLFGIFVPLAADRNNHTVMVKFDLALLVPYAQVNDVLLTLGRKLKKENDFYIVPSISTTLKYVDYYNDRAAKARLRAKKLRDSFWILHPTYTSTVDKSKEAKRHNIEISAVSAAGPSI